MLLTFIAVRLCSTSSRSSAPSVTSRNLPRNQYCRDCRHSVILKNAGSRYAITRVIKAGGQRAVFEAIGEDGCTCAIKQMLDRFTDPRERDEAIARFEAEANILERLRHPRIPRVYADFTDEGYYYLVMDVVRGSDLEDIIRREQYIPEVHALQWADQMCDVLEHLHRQQLPIIFRDLKPSNIMIDPDGNVKLIDFGIAGVFQTLQPGAHIGTPGYAPPEQYQGIATPQSDIFALGATLHHMLTGRDPRLEPPFSFPPVYALRPNISKRTSDAIQKALQMKPEERYKSVAEFRRALLPEHAPAQVRVVPATQAIPAQVAASAPSQPVATTAAPSGSVAPSSKRVTPVVPPPPASVPAAKPGAQPQAPPKARRSRGFGNVVFVLIVLALLAATLALAFPDLTARVLQNIPALATPTPQRLIQQLFTAENIEVIVPPGGDVRQAFVAAYTRIVQEKFGPEARILESVPLSYSGGEPVKIGEDANGVKYRASITGFVLVPAPTTP